MENNKNFEYNYSGFIDQEIGGFKKFVSKIIFRRAEIDNESIDILNEYKEKGSVVFTSYQSSPISIFLLNFLLKKYRQDSCTVAIDCNPYLSQSMQYIFARIVAFFKFLFIKRKSKNIFETEYLEKMINDKKQLLFPLLSSKLFLKRYMERKYDSIVYFIELQKKSDKPIFIMPKMIYWNRNPERTTDSLFTPSATSNKNILAGIIASFTPTHIRFLNPINLKTEIELAEDKDTNSIANIIRYKIMESFQADKRLILGPILKTPQEMMEKVLNNKEVLDAITQISNEENFPEAKLRKNAYKYFKEISAKFSVKKIHFLKLIVEYIMKKIFDGLYWDEEFEKKIKEASQRGPIVLCPSHKSHMDYLILSYLCYKIKVMPPHIAAGVNLSFWPLGPIFRGSGAFFLRRSFKGLKLYPVVFKQYIKTLVNESYPIEFFIEGGRTRTGRLVFPRLGFLNFLIEAIDKGYNEDLVFVPISINYDRVLEESSYNKEVRGKSKQKESVGGVVKSRKLLKRKYGRVYVSADTPFTLKDVEKDNFKGEDRSLEIAKRVIKGINKAININPFSIVTLSILTSPLKGFTKKDIKSNLITFEDFFVYQGVPISKVIKEKENNEEIIDNVLESYINDSTIEELKYDEEEVIEEVFILKEINRSKIAFYKNSIIHYLIGAGFISTSILNYLNKDEDINFSRVVGDFNFFKDLFSIEFIYPDEMNNSENYVKSIINGFFSEKNVLKLEGENISANKENQKILELFSKTTQDIMESYLIVFSLISNIEKKKRLSKKDFLSDLSKEGMRLFHTDYIKYIEASSIPNFKTAIMKLKESNLIEEKNITKRNSDLVLSDIEGIRNLRDKLESFLKNL